MPVLCLHEIFEDVSAGPPCDDEVPAHVVHVLPAGQALPLGGLLHPGPVLLRQQRQKAHLSKHPERTP